MSGPGTRSVHAGERRDPSTGALTTPVYRTSTFRFATTDDLVAGAKGERPGFYTRYGHPNFEVVVVNDSVAPVLVICSVCGGGLPEGKVVNVR